MFQAYTGLASYLFLSYAHKDADEIFPLMERLQQEGCNIWYDEGIHPADEWGETIAKKISDAKALLVVISGNSIQSFNVKREIYYAVSKNIPIIPFYIEDVILSEGLDLQLGIFQAIKSQNDINKDCEKLKEAFPKEVITGEEPVLLFRGKRYSFYFLQHSVCGFSIYKYDHETAEKTMLFKNEQSSQFEIRSTIDCYSRRYSRGDDFYSFSSSAVTPQTNVFRGGAWIREGEKLDFTYPRTHQNGQALSAVLFNVFCNHISDLFLRAVYVDYHFALIDPNGTPCLKILKIAKREYYGATNQEICEYNEENVPSPWNNQLC